MNENERIRTSFPHQTKSQQLGKLGERLFQFMLPSSWNYFQPDNDMGADFIVDVWDEGEPTAPLSLQFAAQIKCHKVLSYEGANARYLSETTLSPPRVHYEKIKTTTFKYLAGMNGQLFSIFLSIEDKNYLHQLCGLFDPDSHSPLGIKLEKKPYYAKAEPELFFVSNLRAISELCKESGIHIGTYIKVPLLPQNSNRNCSNLNKVMAEVTGEQRYQRGAYIDGEWGKLEYDLSKLQSSNLLFHPSWKSKIVHSLSNDRHRFFEKIRYIPFFSTDPAEELSKIHDVNKVDMSVTVEVLLAVSYCAKSRKFRWIERLITEQNQSLNYMVLKCMGIHSITPRVETINTYLSADHPDTIKSFFGNRTHKNEFRMSYIDLLIDFFTKLLNDGEKVFLDSLLTELIKRRSYGISLLIGQLTNGYHDGQLLDLVARMLANILGGSVPDRFDCDFVISASRSLDIPCIALEE